MSNKTGIDFVITWVDGNDSVWLSDKIKYVAQKTQDDGNGRYRDLDLLRYWFRCVSKHANWVDNIYFLTYGHLPAWLNTQNPKLHIVRHEQFIPSKYLPVFSSHPIELNMHRIEGLSDKFVYFNDDMFITSKVEPIDFFVNGKPIDAPVMNALTFDDDRRKVTDLILVNDMYVINRNFDKKTVIGNNLIKWFNPKLHKFMFSNFLLYPWKSFTGMKPMHIPASFCKKTFNEVWEKEYEIMDQTCSHRFRDVTDVNPWLLQFWQLMKGEFCVRNTKDIKYFALYPSMEMNAEVFDSIKKHKYKMICINDGNAYEEYDEVKKQLHKVFEKEYPEKCEFEE